jgi:hypothetical protein
MMSRSQYGCLRLWGAAVRAVLEPEAVAVLLAEAAPGEDEDDDDEPLAVVEAVAVAVAETRDDSEDDVLVV